MRRLLIVENVCYLDLKAGTRLIVSMSNVLNKAEFGICKSSKCEFWNMDFVNNVWFLFNFD